MRFAVVSDLHANLQAWEAVLEDIAHQDVDSILCLGDIVGYGPNPVEVLASIRQHCSNFVLGNHEAILTGDIDPSRFNEKAYEVMCWTSYHLDEEAKQFFADIPLRMRTDDFLCVHASAYEPEEWPYVDNINEAALCFSGTNARLTFLGHSHVPCLFTQNPDTGEIHLSYAANGQRHLRSDRRYLINVGSVGDPRDGSGLASYCTYDEDDAMLCFHKVSFDYHAFEQALRRRGLKWWPSFLPEPVSQPRGPLWAGTSR